MITELKEAGLDVGERCVGRLMKTNGIRLIRTCRHRVTTDSRHHLGVAANLLDGDFLATTPNQKWTGDISHTWTAEGWLYLAVVIDLFSRSVVGWVVSDRMKKDLAIRALEMPQTGVSHPRAAFSIQTEVTNIAPPTSRKAADPRLAAIDVGQRQLL